MDRRRQEFLRHFDQIFVWNGNPEIFMAMVKFMEDRANVLNDTKVGLTRVILLVEDSIRYYSRYLPILYSEILKQTTRLAKDQNMDRMTRTLSMRVRPKVILATSYEEAMAFCDQFQDYLLCVISDRKFPKDGALDREAGIKLIRPEGADPRPADPAPVLGPRQGILGHGPGQRLPEQELLHAGRRAVDLLLRAPGLRRLHLPGPPGRGDRPGHGHGGPAGEAAHRARRVPGLPRLRNHFSAWIMARGEVQVAKVLARVPHLGLPRPGGAAHLPHQHGRLRPAHEDPGQGDPASRTPPPGTSPTSCGWPPAPWAARAAAWPSPTPCSPAWTSKAWSPARTSASPAAIIGTEEFAGFIHRNGLRQMLQSDVGRRRHQAALPHGLAVPGADGQAAALPDEAREGAPGRALLGPAGGQPLPSLRGPLQHLLPAQQRP